MPADVTSSCLGSNSRYTDAVLELATTTPPYVNTTCTVAHVPFKGLNQSFAHATFTSQRPTPLEVLGLLHVSLTEALGMQRMEKDAETIESAVSQGVADFDTWILNARVAG